MEFTNFETERLYLRHYTEEDLSDLAEYLSDPKVVAFEPYKAMNLEEVKEALKYRISSDEFYAVEEKSSHKMIGNIYFSKRYCESYEIGYVFNASFWHKGYAYEAASQICAHAFRNGVHRIEANCDPLNPASWKLLERLGFKREGHLKQNIYFRKDSQGNPIWKDTYIYSKLNPSFVNE